MTLYMLCALWFTAADPAPTIRYAKGSMLALKISAGLWVRKAAKGYCIVGDRLYTSTGIGPKDE